MADLLGINHRSSAIHHHSTVSPPFTAQHPSSKNEKENDEHPQADPRRRNSIHDLALHAEVEQTIHRRVGRVVVNSRILTGPGCGRSQMFSPDCIIDNRLRTISESDVERTIDPEIVRATVVVESETAKNGMRDRNHMAGGCPRVRGSNGVLPRLIHAETRASKNQQSKYRRTASCSLPVHNRSLQRRLPPVSNPGPRNPSDSATQQSPGPGGRLSLSWAFHFYCDSEITRSDFIFTSGTVALRRGHLAAE